MPVDADSGNLWERRLARERAARKQAEQLLEGKSRELWLANQALQKLAEGLERQVEARTAELKDARDRALAASNAKSAFLANMSHEIRTPISGVIGMAELLLDSGLPDQQRQQVQVILQSAKSLLTIINDVLDLSKLESGATELEIWEFNLLELLDDVVDILAIPASRKRLELVAIPEPGLPSRLRGDAARIRQILLNLVGNAVKFTDHGTVSFRVGARDCGAGELRLHVEVSDTGPGIAAADQARLFQMFTQLEDGRARRHQGTGLGLAICKSLVERMRGDIGVQSEPGIGSRFWFTVVLGEPASPSPQEPATPASQQVMLLTQSSLLTESVRAHLRSVGAHLEAVADVAALQEAMREAQGRGRPHDVVLVDLVGMKEQAGSGVLRDALEKRPQGTTCASLDWIDGNLEERTGLFQPTLARPVTRRKLLSVLHSAAATVAPHSVASHGGPEAPPTHVLLVEDSQALQLVIKAKVEKLGYTVDVVGDGREAIEAVRARAYGVVLMDVNLPTLDGVSATREIRALPDAEKASTPIVALTANAMRGDAEAYVSAGMNGYLSKPIDNQELARALATWSGNPRQSR